MENPEIVWKILAEKIEYERMQDIRVLTLRITQRPRGDKLEHVEVKIEQEEESSGRIACVTFEDKVQDEVTGEEQNGGRITGREIGSDRRLGIDVKIEQTYEDLYERKTRISREEEEEKQEEERIRAFRAKKRPSKRKNDSDTFEQAQ